MPGNHLIGGNPGASKFDPDRASGLSHWALGRAIADQPAFLMSPSALLVEELGQPRGIQAGQFRGQNSNDVEDVVGV